MNCRQLREALSQFPDSAVPIIFDHSTGTHFTIESAQRFGTVFVGIDADGNPDDIPALNSLDDCLFGEDDGSLPKDNEDRARQDLQAHFEGKPYTAVIAITLISSYQ